jgi:hypothetical protein
MSELIIPKGCEVVKISFFLLGKEFSQNYPLPIEESNFLKLPSTLFGEVFSPITLNPLGRGFSPITLYTLWGEGSGEGNSP